MSGLPPLSPADAALLTRYFRAGESLDALLDQPDPPPLTDLLAFLARPDITPWIDLYRSTQSHALRHAACSTLLACLANSPDPTHLRLAATALLNHARPRPARADRERGPDHAGGADRASDRPATNADHTLQPPRPVATLGGAQIVGHGGEQPRITPVQAPSATPHPPQWPRPRSSANLGEGSRHPGATNSDGPTLDQSDLDDATLDDLEDAHLDALEDAETRAAAAADPLLAAALTGDLDSIHNFYLERTGQPPDPELARNLSRALQAPVGPAG